MKFLCDVHISYKLVNHLNQLGHETVHVNQILDKWFTKDSEIAEYANENDFIIVSKDSDFRDSFFIKRKPARLIKINLGNISNSELILIFNQVINLMKDISTENSFMIEIDKKSINYIK